MTVKSGKSAGEVDYEKLTRTQKRKWKENPIGRRNMKDEEKRLHIENKKKYKGDEPAKSKLHKNIMRKQ